MSAFNKTGSNFNLGVLYPKEYSSISKACEKGDLELLKKLIDEGKSLDTKDCRGWFPMHFAASTGHTDCLKLLLDTGRG